MKNMKNKMNLGENIMCNKNNKLQKYKKKEVFF